MIAWSRREFLRAAAVAAGGVAASSALGDAALQALAAGSQQVQRSRVVLARSPRLLDERRRIDRKAAAALVDASVRALTDQKDARESWRSLFDPKDVVGIKVNCLGKGALSSQVELVESIVSGLRSVGVERIVVWDRMDEELKAAGFAVRTVGGPYACYGTNHQGVGYHPRLLMHGEIGSLFSRILVEQCTALVNVPVLKDHDLAGVTVAMKNNFGAIHNPNKYHFEPLHRALADLNTTDVIRRKTKLIACDASRIVYNGGPGFKPQWTSWHGGLLMSRDPVATDAVAWREIERLRAAKGLPTLAEAKRPPRYIELASQAPRRLGRFAEEQIERIQVEA